MKKLEVTAKVPPKEEGGKELSATIVVDAPETLEEAGKVYGGEAVLTNALANWVITLQSNIRNGLKRGEAPTAIQARLAAAKMGVASAGTKVDPVQAYLALFASATPEDRKKMLAELQARAAQK